MVKSKWIIAVIIAVVVGVLFYFGVSKIHNSIYEDGKLEGIAQQQQIYAQEQAKLKQDFDLRQKEVDEQRLSLNNKIKELSESNKELQRNIAIAETQRQEEVSDYAKTNPGKLSCFAPNDNGLLIINKTFPTGSN